MVEDSILVGGWGGGGGGLNFIQSAIPSFCSILITIMYSYNIHLNTNILFYYPTKKRTNYCYYK